MSHERHTSVILIDCVCMGCLWWRRLRGRMILFHFHHTWRRTIRWLSNPPVLVWIPVTAPTSPVSTRYHQSGWNAIRSAIVWQKPGIMCPSVLFILTCPVQLSTLGQLCNWDHYVVVDNSSNNDQYILKQRKYGRLQRRENDVGLGGQPELSLYNKYQL